MNSSKFPLAALFLVAGIYFLVDTATSSGSQWLQAIGGNLCIGAAVMFIRLGIRDKIKAKK